MARPGLTPSRATRDKAMPVGPGRRRLSRLESGAGESAAAVTCLMDTARADWGDLLLSIVDYSHEHSLPPAVALLHLRLLNESSLSSPTTHAISPSACV